MRTLTLLLCHCFFFFFSSRRRHTRFDCDWSSDVCSSDLGFGSEAELRKVDVARDVYADPTERERLIAGFDGGEAVRGAEVAWKRKDGKPILVRLSARAVRRADGRIECFETIAEDITERRGAGEEARHAQK